MEINMVNSLNISFWIIWKIVFVEVFIRRGRDAIKIYSFVYNSILKSSSSLR